MSQIITESNLSFDIATVQACILELSVDKVVDREEYLFDRVCEKIDDINSEYLDKFDKKLEEISTFLQSDGTSIEEASKVIKNIGKISSDIFKTQISLYKSLMRGKRKSGRRKS